jgi:hypothetical protein
MKLVVAKPMNFFHLNNCNVSKVIVKKFKAKIKNLSISKLTNIKSKFFRANQQLKNTGIKMFSASGSII